METTKKDWFKLEKILTESDILEIAKKIGEIRKEIDEIEESRKKLKDLSNQIVTFSRQLEQGKITGELFGEHLFHHPEENMVTIRPVPNHWSNNHFIPFTRPMTQEEKEKYCEHVLDLKEPEEDLYREAVEKNLEPETDTFLQDLEANMKIREWVSKLQIYRNIKNDQEYFAVIEGKNHEAIIDPKDSDDVWKYFIVAGFEKYPTKRTNDEILISFIYKNKSWVPVSTNENNVEPNWGEEAEEYDPNKINVYKSAKSERFFILNDVEERVYLEVASADMNGSRLIVFKDPAVSNGYIRKMKDSIILVDLKKGEEHLLNSTDGYDLVENEDGSVSSRLKEPIEER